MKIKEDKEREWILDGNARDVDVFGHSLAIMLLNVQKAHRIINLTAAKTLLIFKEFVPGDPTFAIEAVKACKDIERWMEKWGDQLNRMCEEYSRPKRPKPPSEGGG